MRIPLAAMILTMIVAAAVIPASTLASPTSSFPAQYSPTFYVATNGNDAWSGTIPSPNTQNSDGPFATVAQAQIAVRDLKASQPDRGTPIVVQIEAGTYFISSTLTFTPADSGTGNAPMVYEAAPNATVVISGGKPITGWTQVSGNEWAAAAAGLQYFEQLWVNGQRIYRPNTSAGKYLYFVGPVYSIQPLPSCSARVGSRYECFDRFQFKSGDMSLNNYYDMSDVEIDDFECWTMPVMRLSSVDTVNDTAFLTGPTSRVPNCHGFIAGHSYLVENVREGLAQAGQWYFDRPNDQILYMAAPGENPNSETFIAPQLSQLIVADGLNYVTFQGLTFSNTNWVVPPQGWTSPQGEELSPNVNVPATLSFMDSSYITVEACTISHISNYAISFTGAGSFQPNGQNQITDSSIYDAGGGGIIVGRAPTMSDTDANVAQGTLIQNNDIEGIGRFLPGAYAIYLLNSHNNVVSHNDVHDTYSNGISVGATYEYNIGLRQLAHDNIVEFNVVYDINQGVMEDGGAIYTANGDAQGNKILNNVVHDVTANINSTIHGYGGWGIYFDSTSQNVIAENNLVYRTSFPSIHENDGFNNTVTNNILAFGNYGLIDRSHNNAASLTVSHNIMLWDIDSLQGSFQRGVWTCTATCTSQFLFTANLYCYLNGTPNFITTNDDSPTPLAHTLAEWQALGEDTDSTMANPMFANPYYPADNFTLLSDSTAVSIGFIPFESNLAGLLPGPHLVAPLVPAAFSLQLLNPTNGY